MKYPVHLSEEEKKRINRKFAHLDFYVNEYNKNYKVKISKEAELNVQLQLLSHACIHNKLHLLK